MRRRIAGLSPAAPIAVAVTLLLLATSGRYGYHRDELYFLAAGHHLAWGYPDQPPLVPFLAHVMSGLSPGSLVALRLPSDLAMGALVWVTALLVRELGGDRAAEALAAGAVGLSAVVLGAGHLLSTTTFDLLATAVVLLLAVRIVRRDAPRRWPVVGVVAGLGLLDNDLVAATLVALVGAVVVVGPRRLLRSPWLWAAVAIALAMWSPYLVWQGQHGWPQLTVARGIANGHSGTSTPRWLVLPFQFVLFGPYLAPVWVAGTVRLLRDAALRPIRFVAVGYLLLLALVLASGGKGYYVAGFYALLFAAGAQPSLDWVRRVRHGRIWLGLGFVLSASILPVVLPLVPVGDLHRSPVVALNYDAGETVGWPAYVAEIADVVRSTEAEGSSGVSLVGSNYGEAGAVDRYGGALGLPAAYSGDMGFYFWGPPPGQPGTVVAIGFDRAFLEPLCTSLTLATRLDNHEQVADDEQGAPVWVCRLRAETWAAVWPRFRTLG